MKTRILFSAILISVCIISLVAQSPQKLNYQAVVRGADTSPIVNTTVSFRFAIFIEGEDYVNYEETQVTTTNDYGIVNLTIGEGDPASFADLDWEGEEFSLRIECDPETKQFEIFIETPSTASLLLKEAGVEKGSSASEEDKIGNLTLDQIINVVEAKKDTFLDKTFKLAVKTVLGTALSVGATVEGEDPREIQKRIDKGEYDDKIKGEL